MDTPSTPVQLEVAGAVATVTINRPEARNALSAEVVGELGAVLDRILDDEAVQVVVVTGAGGKAFVAGADLTQLQHYTPASALEHRLQTLLTRIEEFPKPTVAAINGFALGGGLELAMACDIRLASSSARLGLPETGLGILPGAGGTQRLARLVGEGRALEMILTGRIVDAAEALSYGLVTTVVEPDELADEARSVAEQIAARGPLAVRLATLAVRTGMDAGRHTGLVVEHLAQAVLYGSSDKAEGVAAFLEKRSPEFRGE